MQTAKRETYKEAFMKKKNISAMPKRLSRYLIELNRKEFAQQFFSGSHRNIKSPVYKKVDHIISEILCKCYFFNHSAVRSNVQYMHRFLMLTYFLPHFGFYSFENMFCKRFCEH